MAEKKSNTIAIFVTVFVGVLLAVILLTALSGVVVNNVQLTSVTNEAYNLTSLGCMQAGQVNGSTDANCNITVTNAPTGWKQDDSTCYLTSVSLTNSTGTNTLTLNTDYLVNTQTGLVSMLNTTSTNVTNLGNGGIVDINYQYCGADYLPTSWNRSVVGLITGLLALAILVYAIYFAISKFQEGKE